jgi:transcriptional regulator with XRE-family HTH domain
MESLDTKFGYGVRQLRTSLGMSQEKLANMAGIDRAHMGHIERGTVSPSLKKVSQIAKALDVSVESLLADQ